jgi:hypothetical protein
MQASRGIELSVEQLEEVVTRSDLARLPASAIEALSRQVLSKAGALRASMASAPEAWAPMINPWPADLRAILVGPASFRTHTGAGAAADDPERRPHTSDEPWSFRPASLLLRTLIDEWTSMSDAARVDVLPHVAPRLWRWCADSEPADAPDGELHTVDICRGLARGTLPVRRPIAAAPQQHADHADPHAPFHPAEDAILLARLSGAYASLAASAQTLWRSADQPWEMRLLLELFPAAPFVPTNDQLERLLPSRGWLRHHLTRRDLHRDRIEAFGIAQYEFAELPAGVRAKTSRGRVADPWQGTVFRGAFVDGYRAASKPEPYAASPEDLAQDEAHAIEAYGRSPRGIARCSMLALQDRRPNYDALVNEIATRFLLEWARRAGIGAHDLLSVCEALTQPTKARQTGVALDGRDDAEPFKRLGSNGVVVADFLVPLVWRLAAVDQLEELKSLVHRTSGRRGLF